MESTVVTLGAWAAVRRRWSQARSIWAKSPDLRRMVQFGFSTLVGTILFIAMCESLHRILYISMGVRRQNAFLISYIASYLTSILWQHSLNRLFIQTSGKQEPYCQSLHHTFMAYTGTLLISLALGAFLIGVVGLSSRASSIVTLLVGGALNYRLLQSPADRAPGADYKTVDQHDV
ncbi:Uncharacterized protein PBTT_08849 [Plasmodiophora brassicae]